MRVPRSGRLVVALLAAAGIVSCGGGGSPVTGTSGPAIQMAATASGDGQTGTVGASLANPLRVQVLLNGTPQNGDSVTWATLDPGASVAPTRSATDINGIASSSWNLGTRAGAQSLTATLAGATGSPVTFAATAAAGAPSSLSLQGGNDQTGAVNDTLGTPLAVLAGDRYGNPVQGVTVTWSLTGTGSISPASSNTAANGIATATLTLGTAARVDTVSAVAAGLTGSPAVFVETGVVPPATAAVQVGDFYFKSGRNGTQNPAVDTVGVGGTVTWTWVGAANHGVQATGSPVFTDSAIQSTGTYSFTFNARGTYTYDCAVHGAAMTGRVVVE